MLKKEELLAELNNFDYVHERIGEDVSDCLELYVDWYGIDEAIFDVLKKVSEADNYENYQDCIYRIGEFINIVPEAWKKEHLDYVLSVFDKAFDNIKKKSTSTEEKEKVYKDDEILAGALLSIALTCPKAIDLDRVLDMLFESAERRSESKIFNTTYIAGIFRLEGANVDKIIEFAEKFNNGRLAARLLAMLKNKELSKEQQEIYRNKLWDVVKSSEDLGALQLAACTSNATTLDQAKEAIEILEREIVIQKEDNEDYTDLVNIANRIRRRIQEEESLEK